jgi:hypothetical protein
MVGFLLMSSNLAPSGLDGLTTAVRIRVIIHSQDGHQTAKLAFSSGLTVGEMAGRA